MENAYGVVDNTASNLEGAALDEGDSQSLC